MTEKIMKVNELAEILEMRTGTLKSYLINYRFNNFETYILENSRRRLAYKITPKFANEMARMLFLRRKWDAVKLWGEYCSKDYLSILDEENRNVKYR